MKDQKDIFEKRKAKAPVLLDEDDFYLMYFLIKNKSSGYPFPEVTRSHIVAELEETKSFLNISHNSFLTHIKRLEKLGFITLMRKTGEDYKSKLVVMTENGEKFFEAFLKNLSVKYSIGLTFRFDELGKSKAYERYKNKISREVSKK